MFSLLILVFGIISASAVCSMAEAAILSLPTLRARILFEKRRKNAKTLLYLKENINITVASIVFVNNAINIIGSIFVGQRAAFLYGDQWLGLISAIMTFAIIIVGEIIPKTIGERFKVSVSLFFAKPLWVLVKICGPVVRLIVKIGSPFGAGSNPPRVTEEEIKMMLKLGRDAGTVEMDEEVLCNRVFKLNDLQASQMMKPLNLVFALDANKTLEEVKEPVLNSRFSRIPVFDKTPENIVGTVQQSVLLREMVKNQGALFVKNFMSKPISIHQQTKADALLQKFLAYNQHVFIVHNDENKSVGLISMEDVLEELFGEIYDEKDVIHRTI